MTAARSPRRLFLGLGLAIALDTALQLAWKSGVSAVPDAATAWLTVQAMLRQPLLLAVGALMACQYLNWMTVLRHADLSYAHAITSLSYVSVALLSVLLLGESLDLTQAAGIALILVGVWFVSLGGRVTTRVREEMP